MDPLIADFDVEALKRRYNRLQRQVKTDTGWKWMGAQYYDAKWVKKAITRLVLVETLGGIAPPTKQFLHVLAKEAAGTNTDRTVYGAASASASSSRTTGPARKA